MYEELTHEKRKIRMNSLPHYGRLLAVRSAVLKSIVGEIIFVQPVEWRNIIVKSVRSCFIPGRNVVNLYQRFITTGYSHDANQYLAHQLPTQSIGMKPHTKQFKNNN
ncbi:hypothetical protein [Mangrovibacterium lignilyticum]|uniref:hypothetical protein n=1 Tax=Mangrovibacterium lignilyticum TaxID=2668052 RepID=UPI0013D8B351|nr:hypothetical protein [Mangrovibacterium lignilyticum]